MMNPKPCNENPRIPKPYTLNLETLNLETYNQYPNFKPKPFTLH